MVWNVLRFLPLRKIAKFFSLFLVKDSFIYTFLKRLLYFRLAAERVSFNKFESLVYTGTRFYFFLYREIVIAIDSGPLNDTRGTGRVAKNLFAELDRGLTHSSGVDLKQLFLREIYGLVKFYWRRLKIIKRILPWRTKMKII